MVDRTRDVYVRNSSSCNDTTKYGWRDGQLYEIGMYYIEKVDANEVKEFWSYLQPLEAWYANCDTSYDIEHTKFFEWLGVA